MIRRLHTFLTERDATISLDDSYTVSIDARPRRGGGNYFTASIALSTEEQIDALQLALCEARRLLTDPGYLSVTEAERVAMQTWRESDPSLTPPSSACPDPCPSLEPGSGSVGEGNGGAR